MKPRNPFLDLIRVFLTPTAVADSYAGYVLTGALCEVSGEHERLIAVAASSVLVYWFGMAANDLFDLKKDREGAAGRPLACGRISPRSVVASCVLLAVGALLIGVWLDVTPVVGGLLVLVLLYDAGGKKVPVLGNVLMGSCRAGNFLLGGVALLGWGAFDDGRSSGLWVGAALLGLYVAGVTAVSVLEDREFRRGRLLATALPLVAVPVVLTLRAPTDLWNWANSLALIALLGLAVRRACQAPRDGPHGADLFVRQALSGIFLVDAGCLLALAPSDRALCGEVIVLYALFAIGWLWKRRWFG